MYCKFIGVIKLEIMGYRSCFIRNNVAVVVMEIGVIIYLFINFNNLGWTAFFINYKQFKTF